MADEKHHYQLDLERDAAERDLVMAEANFASANDLMADAAKWLKRAHERVNRAKLLSE
jgi:hypothetical protein